MDISIPAHLPEGMTMEEVEEPIAILSTVIRLNRYPNLPPTTEVRLLQKQPISTALQPYIKDCHALNDLKTFYNEEFQRQYNLFERVFGPNPLADWDGIERFQNKCSGILNQYMMHRQFCCGWYAPARGCVCHRGYNPTSLFTYIPSSGPEVERERYKLLLHEYQSFWHELSIHWITKCVKLFYELRSGEEPLIVETEYPEGWTVVSFYRGYAEVQDDEEELGDDFEIREIPWGNVEASDGWGEDAAPPGQPLNELPHLTSGEWLGHLGPHRQIYVPSPASIEDNGSETDDGWNDRWPMGEIYQDADQEVDQEDYANYYDGESEERSEEESEEQVDQEYFQQVLEAISNGALA